MFYSYRLSSGFYDFIFLIEVVRSGASQQNMKLNVPTWTMIVLITYKVGMPWSSNNTQDNTVFCDKAIVCFQRNMESNTDGPTMLFHRVCLAHFRGLSFFSASITSLNQYKFITVSSDIQSIDVCQRASCQLCLLWFRSSQCFHYIRLLHTHWWEGVCRWQNSLHISHFFSFFGMSFNSHPIRAPNKA